MSDLPAEDRPTCRFKRISKIPRRIRYLRQFRAEDVGSGDVRSCIRQVETHLAIWQLESDDRKVLSQFTNRVHIPSL